MRVTLSVVSSIVAETFHDRLAAALPPASAEMLDKARGGGPDYREMHRALMLADRATREWAASAIANQRPAPANRLETLGQLGRPEDYYQEAGPAADNELAAATTAEQSAVAGSVQVLADAAGQLDTEATVAMNTPVFRVVGEAAADVLLAAGAILGGDDFVVEQANQALRALVALDGWQNQLGPRFE